MRILCKSMSDSHFLPPFKVGFKFMYGIVIQMSNNMINLFCALFRKKVYICTRKATRVVVRC